MPGEQEPAAGTPERVPFLLDRVNAQGESPGIAAVFEEVAFAVEQAIREGRTDIAIDTFGALIARESGASDAEVRGYYVLAVRRLTKPVMLTPIARAVVDTPAKAAFLRQLQREPALWLRARPGTAARSAAAVGSLTWPLPS